eukprot:CAMPEP_0118885094 /NCGR_PEP_ID=MMETSP1163-20130328/23708_1 /TAXON_ID=124430 /ORGANISM="Phaeomonas parva, Strain CCMP2877" /LENGTH=92 /DNA_ID=CAMNT_0006823043 /DNA_START=92 /DNA_END=370 /DNA_ORIENTATION=+
MADDHAARIKGEIQLLASIIKRLGAEQEDGKVTLDFGTLFDDDECQQGLETLVGTLKAARREGVIEWKGQMLLKGAHDDTIITLVAEPEAEG